ncbi:MAG: hypothetical protein ACE5HZ_01560 [Fidelibacterota bacterium]
MINSNRPYRRILLVAAVSIFVFHCEKEEDVLGPGKEGLRPTHAVVTMDKDLILSSGRDSSLWQVQLVREIGLDTEVFRSVYTVNMLTDRHGYFLSEGKKRSEITFDTDADGKASVTFYGSREAGVSTTFVWGEGFGLDTVTVAVVSGYPHYLRLIFRDPDSGIGMDTDTLRSGRRLSRPDSTGIEITVLDREQEPLEGVTVNLSNGSPPVGSGAFGYFGSLGTPDEESSLGLVVTNASGTGTDVYYSDVAPAIGSQDLSIIATVEPARFGSISLSKTITIIPP